MEKFLDQVASAIVENSENNLKTAVIFPNKRSEIFLKNILKSKINETFWLPDFFTIDEFITSLSDLGVMDPVMLYFELYEIHKELNASDARSLEDFLAWTPMMLGDFNDIDLNLSDAKEVFLHTSEAKAIQEWNLDRKPLTDMQRNYLAFYNSLFDYYSLLNIRLKKQGVGYKGMLYRSLFESLENAPPKWNWDLYYCVGFNALSRSERAIFSHLQKHYKTRFFWDVDDWYMNPKSHGLEQAEAGRFINSLVSEWKLDPIEWPESLLLTQEKKLRFVGISRRIGQAKYVGQQIIKWQAEGIDTEEDTAIVLADEDLLLPLLNALEETGDNDKKLRYNISMGLSLSAGPLAQLSLQWVELCKRVAEGGSRKFPVALLQSLLNNTLIRLCLNQIDSNASNLVLKTLQDANTSHLSKQEIEKIIRGCCDGEVFGFIDLLLIDNNEVKTFLSNYIRLSPYFKKAIGSDNKYLLLKEQMIEVMHLMKKMDHYFVHSREGFNLGAFQKILSQLFRASQVNLKGEPLQGIQIMGMLETRNLDFKNIILLSANEGILPKSESIDSFIPYDIRSHYKLALPHDHADVYSYYFYRLIQRAEKITILFNTESDALGGGEKSRYLLQLKNELLDINKKIDFKERVAQIPLSITELDQEITIGKNTDIMAGLKKLAKKGFSASSLNDYINCKLKFYYLRLLKLRPTDTLNNSIESDTFGTIVHATLEDLYKPFIGNTISNDELKEGLDDIDSLLSLNFSRYIPPHELKEGKNYLIYNVAKQYVKQFVEADLKQLKKTPRKLLGLELSCDSKLTVGSQEIRLTGNFDRIDASQKDDNIRIIDYKTGRVESSHIKLKEWTDLLAPSKQNKTFQLLMYAYLYTQSEKTSEAPDTGIYSLRNYRSGFLQPKLPDEATLTEGLDAFEKLLTGLLQEIFDPSEPFTKTEDDRICTFCDYKDICNR